MLRSSAQTPHRNSVAGWELLRAPHAALRPKQKLVPEGGSARPAPPRAHTPSAPAKNTPFTPTSSSPDARRTPAVHLETFSLDFPARRALLLLSFFLLLLFPLIKNMKYILGKSAIFCLKSPCAPQTHHKPRAEWKFERIRTQMEIRDRNSACRRGKSSRGVLAAPEPNRDRREGGLPVSSSTGSTWLFNWEDWRAYSSWMEARDCAALQSFAVLFLSVHAAAAYSNPA